MLYPENLKNYYKFSESKTECINNIDNTVITNSCLTKYGLYLSNSTNSSRINSSSIKLNRLESSSIGDNSTSISFMIYVNNGYIFKQHLMLFSDSKLTNNILIELNIGMEIYPYPPKSLVVWTNYSNSTSKKCIYTDYIIESYKWYHINIQLNNDLNHKIYINGIDTLIYGDINTSPYPVKIDRVNNFIGTLPNIPGRLITSPYFNGYIDELKIYNSKLSNEEILNEYLLIKNNYLDDIFFPALWYDFSDNNYLLKPCGDNVSYDVSPYKIIDKSNNRYFLINNDSSCVYNKFKKNEEKNISYVELSGENELSGFNIDKTFTNKIKILINSYLSVFIVMKSNNVVYDYEPYLFGFGNTINIKPNQRIIGDSLIDTNNNLLSYDDYIIFNLNIIQEENSVYTEYINGTITENKEIYGFSMTYESLSLGTNPNNYTDYSSFQISEILIFNNKLTNSFKEKIEGYLATKFNLKSYLPENHSYKNIDIIEI